MVCGLDHSGSQPFNCEPMITCREQRIDSPTQYMVPEILSSLLGTRTDATYQTAGAG